MFKDLKKIHWYKIHKFQNSTVTSLMLAADWISLASFSDLQCHAHDQSCCWLTNINATEEAADDIAAVLSHNTNLTELNLNGNNLQSAGVIKIAQSLQNVNTLKGLGLGNINATEEAADDIAAVLSHNTNLTVFHLNGNNLQSAGVIKIAQSLQNVNTLQELWLANINATEEAADDIAAVLSHNTNLTVLDLHGNNLQSAVRHWRVYTEGREGLRNINATEEAADDIAAVLSHNTNLTVLDLDGNNLQSAGVIKIAQSLQNVSTLQKLGLGNINATEEAADDIAAVLSHQDTRTLQKLRLGNINATEEAADDIAAVLSHNTNLTVLDLHGNNLQSAGVIKIAQSLQNVSTLQKLRLGNINATEEAADDIAVVLSHNTNLTVLHLNGNNLQSAGVIKIAQSLQNLNNLQVLGLRNINATEEAADDIAAVLSHNTNLTVLNLDKAVV
ncbi:ribonuclease inhibitor-like [Dysidea avara]|uniref:ribonuclease inhibitor-like n=1 Tax=Dysidea avara TaxID=196820 RepID=UPI00332ABC72